MDPQKRRLKKVKRRTPGRRVVIHFRREKTGKHVCALCGKPLHGVPHGRRPAQVRKLSKSERRPERLFGGVLCSECVRKVLDDAFYVKTGVKRMEEVDLKERKFVEQALKVVAA